MKNVIFLLCIGTACMVLFSACQENPNLNKKGVDIIESKLTYVDRSHQAYQDTVYIPIYSDIYSESSLRSTLLTATLSIRSTSLTENTYIHAIEYYNTQGELVKSYLDRSLLLAPLQSIDYVIDRDDNSGGVGANFIVEWGADHNVKPLFQAVMIGTSGQHGLSFVTEGVSIKK